MRELATRTKHKGLSKLAIKVHIRKWMAAKYGADKKAWPSKLHIAHELGMTTNTVRAWMDERILRLDFETLDKWCNFLNVNPGDILIKNGDDDE